MESLILTFVCTLLLLPLAGPALMGERPSPFAPPLPGLCSEARVRDPHQVRDPQTLASAAR